MRMPRSFLYVPANQPDRLARAHTRGADAVVADLEDAVIPPDKDQALSEVENWLKSAPSRSGPQLWTRINSGDRGLAEVKALAGLSNLTGIFVPKVESVALLAELRAAFLSEGTALRLAPMIESAAGLTMVTDIARATGVHQLHLGEIDLAADLGMTPGVEEAELAHARAAVVVASRCAGVVAPAAPVSSCIDDSTWFERSTRALARMGFVGRDCIHPSQVAVANTVFTPSSTELEWARSVLSQSDTERGSFRGPDGSMVDEAVLRRARRLLETFADHLGAAADA